MSQTERHPLSPFLPVNAKVLMLGSFPPQRKRWAMEFYYPNWNNDMWRIMGLVFYHNKTHFLDEKNKTFRKEDIINFLNMKGIAIFDTATEIRRLQDNASDKFLEVIQPTDIKAMLNELSSCLAVVTTGQKATETLLAQLQIPEPKVGGSIGFEFNNRLLRLYRMPSSSRAYPLALDRKAKVYCNMFQELQIIE